MTVTVTCAFVFLLSFTCNFFAALMYPSLQKVMILWKMWMTYFLFRALLKCKSQSHQPHHPEKMLGVWPFRLVCRKVWPFRRNWLKKGCFSFHSAQPEEKAAQAMSSQGGNSQGKDIPSPKASEKASRYGRFVFFLRLFGRFATDGDRFLEHVFPFLPE